MTPSSSASALTPEVLKGAAESLKIEGGGGLFDKLKLFDDPQIAKETSEIANGAMKERTGLWESITEVGGNWAQSWIGRQSPQFAKFLYAAEGVAGGAFGWEETTAWEHELQVMGGLTMFIPDSFLRPFTDAIKEPILAMLRVWPGGEKLIKHIESEDDPDRVIEAVMVLNQDISTGKVTLQGIWDQTISRFAA